MSTTGRPDADATAASDVAVTLREAGFVRLVAAGTGDAVASAGLLARALTAVDVPYQLSVTPLPDRTQRQTDADVTVALGREATGADVTLEPASRRAHDIADALGTADLALALAGTVAGGDYPDGDLLERGTERGLARRPGVAIPTADVVDGLVHSTLVHTTFSGAPERIDSLDVPAEMDADGRRELASLVALTVGSDPEGTPRGAEQVERLLRPLAGGPFRTVGGYADVLDCLARSESGLAVALSLGGNERERALSAWRTHARQAHEAVRTASASRYDGLSVLQCGPDAPVGTVARLARDFRSREPVVLAVANGVAEAVAGEDAPKPVGEAMEAAATAVDGTGAGTATRGRARFDDATAFVAAFREAL